MRKVIVYRYKNIMSYNSNDEIKEYSGYFHKWVKAQGDTMGLIEDGEGYTHLEYINTIKFLAQPEEN